VVCARGALYRGVGDIDRLEVNIAQIALAFGIARL
jgi:hypothetical protein